MLPGRPNPAEAARGAALPGAAAWAAGTAAIAAVRAAAVATERTLLRRRVLELGLM
jgi:hypothetical protein